jgi:hypothetical protein
LEPLILLLEAVAVVAEVAAQVTVVTFTGVAVEVEMVGHPTVVLVHLAAEQPLNLTTTVVEAQMLMVLAAAAVDLADKVLLLTTVVMLLTTVVGVLVDQDE